MPTAFAWACERQRIIRDCRLQRAHPHPATLGQHALRYSWQHSTSAKEWSGKAFPFQAAGQCTGSKVKSQLGPMSLAFPRKCGGHSTRRGEYRRRFPDLIPVQPLQGKIDHFQDLTNFGYSILALRASAGRRCCPDLNRAGQQFAFLLFGRYHCSFAFLEILKPNRLLIPGDLGIRWNQ